MTTERFPHLAKRLAANQAESTQAGPAIISMPSPNASPRPNGPDDIECIVLHHTARGSVHSAPFVGRYFQNPQVKASVHYIVGRGGEIVQCVLDHQKANHAGPSVYRGRQNVNNFSIGIEVMALPGQPYTDKQYTSLKELLLSLMKSYSIPAERIIPYRQVALPGAKLSAFDASFDWKRLRSSLLSRQTRPILPVRPEEQKVEKAAEGLRTGDIGPMVFELQEDLSTLHYFEESRISGYFGEATHQAVKQFQADVGLGADGIYGPRTKTAVKEVIASLEHLEHLEQPVKKAPLAMTGSLSSGTATRPLVPRTYKVRTGDTLAAIAQRFLGSASRWQEIFNLNRNQLSNPDRLYPGMVLRLAT